AEIAPNCPKEIYTDQMRFEQIIKNLITNALKFTSQGSVTIRFSSAPKNFPYRRKELANTNNLQVDVEDTGIGIPKEKQRAIFEAFQQADGSTARKFGGTGLGLSISRELAQILGGEIHLESTEGKGSKFTVVLPVSNEPSGENSHPDPDVIDPPAANQTPESNSPTTYHPPVNETFIQDDRENTSSQDQVILVVEDDPEFAKILLNQCRSEGFKCMVSPDGEQGLELARKFVPDAILLDIRLPGMDGWQVLHELKQYTTTRHIPVHVVSGIEETMDVFQKGAVGFLHKPVTKESLSVAFNKIEHFIGKSTRNLLIVEDDENLRHSIKKLLKSKDLTIIETGTARECIKLLKKETFDCMILDLGLPDMNGFDLLSQLNKLKSIVLPPIIVYTGKELDSNESEQLKKYTNSIIIKGVKSEERLLDEATLFLHQMIQKLPQSQQKIIRKLYDQEDVFKNREVLLVDDDMRNVFALTKVLEEKGMKVIKAANGIQALKMLDDNHDPDLILMDIMMPGIDGYEAIKTIRKQSRYENLPIIAMTAKAMKEDRQKCLNAGASDYISKPIELTKLLSLLRVWLSKE
ncbi:MAG: response regulator, partial [Bacteroidales bacterium]|nr:response regulator [Bacteroidales bacterium]